MAKQLNPQQTSWSLTVRLMNAAYVYCDVAVRIQLSASPKPPQFSQMNYIFQVPCNLRNNCIGSVSAVTLNGSPIYSVANESYVVGYLPLLNYTYSAVINTMFSN